METCLKKYHKKRDNLVLKSKCFDSKIKLSHALILFQTKRTSFLRHYTMQRNEKKYLKQNSKDFCVDKKWYHYVCIKKNYLHEKYKDFQFSMLKEWNASKREKYGTKCLGENVWRWLAHLFSGFTCNARAMQAQIHHLCETNYCNKV